MKLNNIVMFVLAHTVYGIKGGGGLLPRAELVKTLYFYGMTTECSTLVLDTAEEALSSWSASITPFLAPIELLAAQKAFKNVADVHMGAEGGFPQAERRRLIFERGDSELADLLDATVTQESEKLQALRASCATAVRIDGSFVFDTCTEDDFMEAIHAAGIRAEDIGDVVVTRDRGAQVILAPHIASAVVDAVRKVKSVPVECKEIPLSDIDVPPQRIKEMVAVEASARLDAVASAGFGISRGKVTKLLKAGKVMVDWKLQTSSSYTVKAGELVSIRGMGRLDIADLSSTAKGRTRIKLTRTW